MSEGFARHLVTWCLPLLVGACGPSDTIDVSAPELPPGPSTSRPDPAPSAPAPELDAAPMSGSDAGAPLPVSVDAAAVMDGAVVDAARDVPAPPADRAVEAPADRVVAPDRPATAPDAAPVPPPAADAAPAAPEVGAAVCPPSPARADVISDFAEGSLLSLVVGTRGGTSWDVVNDGEGATATLSAPEIPVFCGSRWALRFVGTSTATQNPILRLVLVQGAAQFYNANEYSGVRFFLRGGAAQEVGVKLLDRNTISAGGQCVMCNDHFSTSLRVTTDWKHFTVPFASLKQRGTGDAEESLDEANLYGIELLVRGQASFELLVDDVSFYR